MQVNGNDPTPARRRPRSAVIGLGRTGLSCARHLRRAAHEVLVMDDRENPPARAALLHELPEVSVHAGSFDAGLLDGVDQLVVSPGVSLREPIVREAEARGVEVLGDIELFLREVSEPIVAVTGSNGKSTVTTMTAVMLEAGGRRALAGGNLGEPVLDLLHRARSGPAPDVYVLELSSFQLERTRSLAASAAVVLNVSADHLDRHDGLAGYAAAKAIVYRGCATAVVNRDDSLAAGLAVGSAHRISFGLDAPADHDYGLIQDGAGDDWLARGNERLAPAASVPLVGRHNLANALAALALTDAAGGDVALAARALNTCRGLEHRTEPVLRHAGVLWIDDSKATNVGATIAAVAGMDGPVVLIAGGRGKGADFGPLAQALRGRARLVLLIGEDAPLLEEALADACATRRVDDMDAAVAAAAAAAEPGDTVLLSPACASQDMYRDFAERGEVFRRAVRRVLS